MHTDDPIGYPEDLIVTSYPMVDDDDEGMTHNQDHDDAACGVD